jgi:large subunit ribosomal protein L18
MNPKEKREKRERRHRRVRGKISGTAAKPRLCVFRSYRHIYAQLIDDEKGKTLAAVSDLDLGKSAKKSSSKKGTDKKEAGYEVGKLIAQEAAKLKVAEVIFDRGGYKYHGRVKRLAEGAREGGLKF